MSNAALLKRLSALEDQRRFRRARMIVVWTDGNDEDQSAADAILRGLDVRPNDIAILIGRFSGTDPELPLLHRVTPL